MGASDLEEIASQTDIHGNTRSNRGGRGGPRGLFGFGLSPSIERASAARERKAVAIESPKPEAATPVTHLFFGSEAVSYSELINAIRDRVGQLGIRYEDFDVLAGFAPGLTGKAFGPSQAKRLGSEKLFDALRAASLKIRIEPDEQQLAKMQKQMAENCQPRQANQARMNNRNHLRPSEPLIDRVLKHLANSTNGGLARLNKAVKQARSNHARRTIAIGVNWAQQRNSVGFTALLALPPPADRETLDACAEEEATAA
jgi:hypothetical protein